MDLLVVTNNPLVFEKLSSRFPVLYFEKDTYREVLIRSRDLIHKGHRLLTHPLSGSVKPNETPYKSVGLTRQTAGLDMESLEIMENAIAACDKFRVKYPQMDESMKADFALIDYTLFTSGL